MSYSFCRLSFQEFFGRAVDKTSWGKPAAALLGALDAQLASGCASIGGKDSMSGTFENLNVPNTLVSFAVTTDDVKNITSGSFKKANSSVYAITGLWKNSDKDLVPNFEYFNLYAQLLYRLNAEGKINAMYPVKTGGIAEAVSKMAMGNRIGFKMDSAFDGALFSRSNVCMLVETDCNLEEVENAIKIGNTIAEPEIILEAKDNQILKISIAEIEKAWEAKLSVVFPPVSNVKEQKPLEQWAIDEHSSLKDARKSFNIKTATVKPRVVIPVFPGTNCEYDMARAFNLNGADTQICVFRNRTPSDLSLSLDTLKQEIDKANIIAFAGGFSAGDEPDGSGKFIANVIREHRIADSIMDLLKNRDGLVLGICNGFQALIKTGLVPYGEIREMSDETPTLTYNTIGRHISRVVRTRMVSAKSAWAKHPSIIEPLCHLIPVSHGEGRVVLREELAKELFANGQIFSQYADINGNPAISEPDNPNGSLFAIEGMTSPDGRVLGKMGHNERTIELDYNSKQGVELLKNISSLDEVQRAKESPCQNIFAAGVSYFA